MDKPTIGERAKAQIDKQTKKGLEKYGMLLDDNPAPVEDCINHMTEELADGLQYAIWIKDGISKLKKEVYRKAISDICDHFKDAGILSYENLETTGAILINQYYKENDCRTKK